jgi:hypothetical protein
VKTQPSSSSSQVLSPWLAIWIKPRAAIRWIVDSDPGHQNAAEHDLYWVEASIPEDLREQGIQVDV